MRERHPVLGRLMMIGAIAVCTLCIQSLFYWLKGRPELMIVPNPFSALLMLVASPFMLKIGALMSRDDSLALTINVVGLCKPKPPAPPEKEISYWPYCVDCHQPFEFDQHEPFAYCKCGATEWGDPRPAPWVPDPSKRAGQELAPSGFANVFKKDQQ